ncbi:ScbR family autoregulator-binding transcription factor [Streptomyces sp. MJP52]|uniref:ScbR family autoregulator-binding transcription factor n=1 Tax=Streptomyces sp. MJP52 TaxID=2940555 RepID=UPI002474C6B7|nr:ScbR family autoregulator-binding transcription factor [Streptomyces sp. MJP52]MDH6229358.1 AcrR family transcriptional regulator [Streptomyces sp. MJP52]
MTKQERATRTRHALIRAAAEVFTEEAFASASLSSVSGRAGVSNGALYFHFSSKNAMAVAVQEEASARLAGLTASAEARGGEALDVLVHATHLLVSLLETDSVLRAGFRLAHGRDVAGGVDLRRQWHRWVEGTLRQALTEGRIAVDAPVDAAASAVVALTTGWELLSSQELDWLSPDTVTAFWQLLLPRLSNEAVV